MVNMVALGPGSEVYALAVETDQNEFFMLRAARERE